MNVLVSFLMELMKYLPPTNQMYLSEHQGLLKEHEGFYTLYIEFAEKVFQCLQISLVRAFLTLILNK